MQSYGNLYSHDYNIGLSNLVPLSYWYDVQEQSCNEVGLNFQIHYLPAKNLTTVTLCLRKMAAKIIVKSGLVKISVMASPTYGNN